MNTEAAAANEARKAARTEAEATYSNQYVTIGKGKTVWFVESVSFAGLHLSASVPGRTAYKTVGLDELGRVSIWTR